MKKHILFIDDDTEELRIFLDAMNKVPVDFKCTYANTSHQAIDMLKHVVPDYIFIDYRMPKINGLQFLAIVRGEDKLKKVRMFLYTSRVSEEVSKMAKVLGANGCIEKTDTISLLAVELKSILMPGITAYPYFKTA
jgi:CheY-like chemotaxis protein